jgi:hypothetical protein
MGSRAILTPSTDHLITIASNPQAGDEPRRWWRAGPVGRDLDLQSGRSGNCAGWNGL